MADLNRYGKETPRISGRKEKRVSTPDSVEKQREYKMQFPEKGFVRRRTQELLHDDDTSVSAPSGNSQQIKLTSKTENRKTESVSTHIYDVSTDEEQDVFSQSQYTSMSQIVENFNKLFETATSLPEYSDKMQNAATAVYAPMFKEFTEDFKKHFSTNFATQIKDEISNNIKSSMHIEFEKNTIRFE